MIAATLQRPSLGPAGSLGAIEHAVVRAGTPELRSMVSGVLARASASAHVDAFRISDPAVVDGIGALRARGATVSVLADTEASTGDVADRLRSIVSSWQDYGAPPRKQHGKSVTRDGGAEAVVGTDVSDAAAASRIEIGARFDGPAAAALGAVQAASPDTPNELKWAIQAAAREGVVVNDPRAGVRLATQGVEALLQEARDLDRSRPVRIVTKDFDSGDMADRIARLAKDRDVELLTQAIPDAQRARLEGANVDVQVIDGGAAAQAGTGLHGTIIDAGGQAFVGSLYLVDRVLHGSKGRQSRELGVLLRGDAADQAAAAVDRIYDVALPAALPKDGEAPRPAAPSSSTVPSE